MNAFTRSRTPGTIMTSAAAVATLVGLASLGLVTASHAKSAHRLPGPVVGHPAISDQASAGPYNNNHGGSGITVRKRQGLPGSLPSRLPRF